jgi:membrane-bound lytic murein transglycosylase B
MNSFLRISLPVLFSLSIAANAAHAGESSLSDSAGGSARTAADEEGSGEFANFVQWKEVSDFLDQMVAKHAFNRTELESVFGKLRYIERAVQLVKPAPPGQPKNWRAYRARFVEPVRINAGVAFWDQYADALSRAEEQYKVPAEIIVGIIGVETVYGRNTGNFRVMDALTTLAFAYPETSNRAARMTFFRGEVENTLLLARESGIVPLSLSGSYAGAVGWPQFMPGSIRQYAVDFDGDRQIDLRGSPIDAIGSVANFLVRHGWKAGEPLVFPATVTGEGANRWESLIGKGLVADYRLDELKAVGAAPGIEPPEDLLYGLVDLQNGYEPTEYWIGADNFFAITKYNRSFFYAMSVIELGRAVKAARER